MGMLQSMFGLDADEIFRNADVKKIEAPEFYDEIEKILAQKMADLSVNLGLSFKRVEIYNEQKAALIEDLKALKKAGTLR